MDLKEIITEFVAQNPCQNSNYLDAQKREFYTNQLKLKLLAIDSGIDPQSIKCNVFTGNPNGVAKATIEFFIDEMRFEMVCINSGAFHLKNENRNFTFCLPSPNVATSLNLQVTIAEWFAESSKK